MRSCPCPTLFLGPGGWTTKSIRWQYKEEAKVFFYPSTLIPPGQAIQQHGGVHEVGRREAFRERAVDGRQRGAGLVAAALSLPEPRQAHRGPQLPRPALLSAGRLDGLAEAV